jgi:hypothetical protein
MQYNLNREIYFVQNPSISSAIFWRFICGYYSTKQNPVPFPLLFIILPIIFRKDLREIIQHTYKKSGLSKVSEKLFTEKKNDQLYSIHHAVKQYKDTSLSAISIGLSANLFSLNIESAFLYPLTEVETTHIQQSCKELLSSAEKLGVWCSELTLHEISMLLKVRF